eukprot:202148_1
MGVVAEGLLLAGTRGLRGGDLGAEAGKAWPLRGGAGCRGSALLGSVVAAGGGGLSQAVLGTKGRRGSTIARRVTTTRAASTRSDAGSSHAAAATGWGGGLTTVATVAARGSGGGGGSCNSSLEVVGARLVLGRGHLRGTVHGVSRLRVVRVPV